MTQSEDYRKYLEEKFSGLNTHINAQFENVHERLDRIEIQTTKTNGRVTLLENTVEHHPIHCDVKPVVEKIQEDLAEYRFFKKYPKVFIGILLVTMLSIGFALYETYTKVSSNSKQNTEIIYQIDSLKNVK